MRMEYLEIVGWEQYKGGEEVHIETGMSDWVSCGHIKLPVDRIGAVPYEQYKLTCYQRYILIGLMQMRGFYGVAVKRDLDRIGNFLWLNARDMPHLGRAIDALVAAGAVAVIPEQGE
jgi:hypothetical protein